MARTPTCLPRPHIVKARAGRFNLARHSPIVLSPSCDEADYFAATILSKEIEKRSSFDPVIVKHARATGLERPICLVRFADMKKAGFPKVKPAGQLSKLGDEGYVIEAALDHLVVAANASAGIYYGVQTLRQMLDMRPGRARLDAAAITDWPDFRYRGVMHDISRGKVPRLETLFRLVEMLASLKVNVLQLYTEHTFAFRRHPDIGRSCGSFSAEDILKLDEHARRHHVELQANLQSFGHMSHILSLARYKDLAESERGWTLQPGRAATYELLGDLYAEHLPCFTSRIFNADCDETWDLGKGRSKKRVEKVGVGRVYLDHIERLRSLARTHGKRLAIWGDIVLQHPELIKSIPKDIILLNWGYGARHNFASTRRFARARLEHWVCPGTNSWRALFPRIEVACANISGFAREGVRTKATGLLSTDWGDGGHPNLLGTSFHGFAFGAEAAWSGPARDPVDFDRRFSWALIRNHTGIVGKIFRMLGRTNDVFDKARGGSLPFGMYWAEFPDGEALALARPVELGKCERLARAARGLMSVARQILPAQRMLLDELDFAARQTILACQKARLARRIMKAVPRVAGEAAAGFGGKGLPSELVAEVAEIHRDWRVHRDEFERLWLARARRSEIEIRLRLYREREQELARLAEPSARRPYLA